MEGMFNNEPFTFGQAVWVGAIVIAGLLTLAIAVYSKSGSRLKRRRVKVIANLGREFLKWSAINPANFEAFITESPARQKEAIYVFQWLVMHLVVQKKYTQAQQMFEGVERFSEQELLDAYSLTFSNVSDSEQFVPHRNDQPMFADYRAFLKRLRSGKLGDTERLAAQLIELVKQHPNCSVA